MENINNSENTKNYSALDIVEIVSAVASVGGAIASVVFQQIAFASLPLSLSVALNLVNRRQQIARLDLADRTIMEQLSNAISQNQNAIQTTSQELTELSQAKDQLGTIVEYLKKIEGYNQAIQGDSKDVDAYYQRGVNLELLGHKEAAIADYNRALQLNNSHAYAYYNRGLLLGNLGDRRGAVDDLRAAAKFFLQNGDVGNYQKAKTLSAKFHELLPQEETNGKSGSGTIEGLFAS